jgi:hypothetical protein
MLAAVLAAVLVTVAALAATKPPVPAHPSLAGHWQGTMRYATGGAGQDLIDVVIRGSGRHMTGTITYPGNPCHGPLRGATSLGAGRWRFRYIERSHSQLACPSSADHVLAIRFGPNLFLRDTTTKTRITGLLTFVP